MDFYKGKFSDLLHKSIMLRKNYLELTDFAREVIKETGPLGKIEKDDGIKIFEERPE